MPHNTRMNRRQATVLAMKPVTPGSRALQGTVGGVKYTLWTGTTPEGKAFWTVNLPGEDYRVERPGYSGPGFGGTYPTRGQGLGAIADGTALAHAKQNALG